MDCVEAAENGYYEGTKLLKVDLIQGNASKLRSRSGMDSPSREKSPIGLVTGIWPKVLIIKEL